MKAKLTKTSDWDFEKKIDVETIEDALAYHNKLVIRRAGSYDKTDGFEDCEIVVEIYDDWRE